VIRCDDKSTQFITRIYVLDKYISPQRIMSLHDESILGLFNHAFTTVDWTTEVRFPAEAGNFSLHRRVQTGSGAHPLCTVVSFPGLKRPRPEIDHSPLSSADVNAWSCTSTPPYVCMAWCL